MANGKVITGYSLPKVALYTNSSGTVTYSSGMALARGVDVSFDIESADDNNFYADNVKSESEAGVFKSGTITLTVDGLKKDARDLIMGVATTTSVTVSSTTVSIDVYDDEQDIPYVGIGFIVRYMEEGVTTYAPIVLRKCAFNQAGLEAATQEEDIDWQTQTLEAEVMRDDTSTHQWMWIADDQSTEELAEAVLEEILSIS